MFSTYKKNFRTYIKSVKFKNNKYSSESNMNKKRTYKINLSQKLFNYNYPIFHDENSNQFSRLMSKKYSSSKGNIKLELIYKATVDSDFSNAFHSKCDNHSPTITIIKTDQGLRFGGYTTKTWNYDEECKTDDEAFLFSMDYKKKYLINKYTDCAIYCHPEYGPTFGEGFDLCLCDNYMGVNGSYSNFPKSYGKGNPTHELTGKNPNFRIAYVEVYQINYSEE